MDASEEVLTPMNGAKIIFPIADGTLKLYGEDQVLRTFTLIRDRQDRGEEQGNLIAESAFSSLTPLPDSSLYDGEVRNDFWSISGNFLPKVPGTREETKSHLHSSR